MPVPVAIAGKIDLDHLDHTIRVIDPDADIVFDKVKPFPPKFHSFRGEMARFVLGTVPSTDQPVTSLEVAKAVIEGRGLNVDDPRTVSLFRKRVGACLSKLKRIWASCARSPPQGLTRVGSG